MQRLEEAIAVLLDLYERAPGIRDSASDDAATILAGLTLAITTSGHLTGNQGGRYLAPMLFPIVAAVSGDP